MLSLKTIKSFTLMELMAVVIIIGIIAAFAVPNYRRSIDRAHLRDAINNLTAIHAANQIHYSEDVEYWPPDAGPYDLTTVGVGINDSLNLNIIANELTYSCAGSDGSTFTCTAQQTGGFTATVTEADAVPGTNPACTASCP